ncbi:MULTISPECIES: DUF982 domain-containing protein [Mesorhizobium]|uniref:DUF982 domain-containing protein n=1 Tax=Mesorhizobium TaxID=68287 RepID=UPI0012041506|nr:MAG: DUF982 domain-containing protein [Mesorhizobium sp.]TJU94249.1 MAG: DUF982 domain-containing protein [Mesorhizobium sp.]TJV44809.1 MAG: DUF982 domain-containing protein [Mesorhizobium sp.]
MLLGPFHPPVPISATGEGEARNNIKHVQAAREQLLQWTKRGPEWYLAADACLGAIEGKVTPNEVRKAFIEAAREEGRLLSD